MTIKLFKNDVSGITAEMLDEIRNRIFYSYQKLWWDHRGDRVRLILKSPMIVATYYFSWEAFNKAIVTGKNQIFLSERGQQAEVIKLYIIAFAQQYFGLELKGSNVILLSNGAEICFLSDEHNNFANYHGDVYLDEFLWMSNFNRLRKIANGIAAHKQCTTTLFSTFSGLSHEAYAEWSGEEFNKGKTEESKVTFDISYEALKNGAYGADKKWRHIVGNP